MTKKTDSSIKWGEQDGKIIHENEMDRTITRSRLYRNERIKSLFQREQELAEYLEQVLNEEERSCKQSDADKMAAIAFKRRRTRELRPRLRDMISRIEKEPEKYLTADGLQLDLDFYQDGRVPVDAWSKAYSQFGDVERTKQELQFWKELARDAICAAKQAGVNLSALRTAYPLHMAELDAEPPF